MLDTDSFITVYDTLSPQLLRYFMRRTLDPEVAADLTAETFAAALRSRASFRAGSNLEAWIQGIATHQLSHYYRRGRVEDRARRKLELATPPLSESGRDQIRALVDGHELEAVLEQALESLPRDQRVAVQLRVVDELEYDEIAARMGCGPESARARVSRGLRALRATLEQSEFPLQESPR